MKRIALFLTLALASCATVKPLVPVEENEERAARARCASIFQISPFRAVHSIEAKMPFGEKASLMGATVADPKSRSLRSALISVEGLTLFEASFLEGKIVVHRAMPPLDAPEFAEGFISDILFILFAPESEVNEIGLLGSGETACRYKGSAGGLIDMILKSEEGYELIEYAGGSSIVRRLFVDSRQERGFPIKITFERKGAFGYSLSFELLEAEFISSVEELLKP